MTEQGLSRFTLSADAVFPAVSPAGAVAFWLPPPHPHKTAASSIAELDLNAQFCLINCSFRRPSTTRRQYGANYAIQPGAPLKGYSMIRALDAGSVFHVSAKEPDAAKEHMESAEREVAALEKFLGR